MNPELFELPGFEAPLRSHPLLVALALFAAWLWSLSMAAEDELPAERLGWVFVAGVVSAVVGARLFWVLQQPGSFDGVASLVVPRPGELAWGGGVLAGVAVSAVACRRLGVPLAAWLDCLAPALLLVVFADRVGAFLAGVDFGTYAPDLPWSVRYPYGSPAHIFHLRNMPLIATREGGSLPVHPTPVYGAACVLVGLLAARWLRRRQSPAGRGAARGRIAWFCLGVFALAEMLLEPSFRVRPVGLEVFGVDLDRLAGGFFVLLAAYGGWRSGSGAPVSGEP